MRKKFLLIGSLATFVSISILAVSCETGTGDKEGDGSGKKVREIPTVASLTDLAQKLEINYLNKNNIFTAQLFAEGSIPSSGFSVVGIDTRELKVDYIDVTQQPTKGIVSAKFTVSTLDDKIKSQEVTYVINGFKPAPIEFDETKKSSIETELNKAISNIHLNLVTFDLVIQNGDNTVDLTNPETYIKIGKLSPDYFDTLQLRFDDFKRIKSAPKPTPKVEQKPPSTGSENEKQTPPPPPQIKFEDLPIPYFPFSIVKEIWERNEESLNSLFESEYFKLILDPPKNLTTNAKNSLPRIPFNINLKEELLKLIKTENNSFGFNINSYFVPTTEAPINFTNAETFKEILRTVPRPNGGNAISGTDWFDFIPLLKVGGVSNENLNTIYNLFNSKLGLPLVLQRKGSTELIFTFYPGQRVAAFPTPPAEVPASTS